MANCRISADTADMSAVVRRSNASVIRNAEGIPAVLKVVNNLEIIKADGTSNGKVYAGIVPVVNGTERRDLALTQYDLLIENVPTHPKGDEVEFFTPQDRLHKTAREQFKDGITMQAWLDAIASAMCPNGATCTLASLNYTARNLRGGTFQGSILGAN